MSTIGESEPIRLWRLITENKELFDIYENLDPQMIRRVRRGEQSLGNGLEIIEKYLHSIPAPESLNPADSI